jgi:hypothetical protein
MGKLTAIGRLLRKAAIHQAKKAKRVGKTSKGKPSEWVGDAKKQIQAANVATSKTFVSTVAASRLGKAAYPMSIEARNAIKIGLRAARSTTGIHRKSYDPFLGKGMPAQKARRRNMLFGRPMAGSNPLGVQSRAGDPARRGHVRAPMGNWQQPPYTRSTGYYDSAEYKAWLLEHHHTKKRQALLLKKLKAKWEGRR